MVLPDVQPLSSGPLKVCRYCNMRGFLFLQHPTNFERRACSHARCRGLFNFGDTTQLDQSRPIRAFIAHHGTRQLMKGTNLETHRFLGLQSRGLCVEPILQLLWAPALPRQKVNGDDPHCPCRPLALSTTCIPQKHLETLNLGDFETISRVYRPG